MKKLIFLFLIILSTTFAITILEPVKQDIKNGDTIDLGEIGPGQTTFVRIEPHVSEGGKFGNGGDYDLAVPFELPPNWNGTQSYLYGKPLHVSITAAKDAPQGDYSAKILVQELKGDQIQNITFKVKIKITWNVLETSISPTSISVGPGQPARYNIAITNKGNAGDVFVVSSLGLKRWQFKREVYVPPKNTRVVTYEIVENEEASYAPVITIESKASNIIKDQKQVDFQVITDLKGDYKATNHGVLIMPMFESIIYSFMGLLSNLF